MRTTTLVAIEVLKLAHVSRGGEPETIDKLFKMFRDDVLDEAIAALEDERLTDDTGYPEDIAYNDALDEAQTVILMLKG